MMAATKMRKPLNVNALRRECQIALAVLDAGMRPIIRSHHLVGIVAGPREVVCRRIKSETGRVVATITTEAK